MDDLARRFRDGDPDAVRAVYRRHAGAVTTVVRSLVGGDDGLCADVVQQTFINAWRAASTVDADRDLAPWLYAIARHAAIDALRHERRPTYGDHAPEVEVAAGAPDPLDRLWQAYEVRRAVDGLPADEREVVRLSHLVGLTHAEIAERTGVPLGTVKSRSHRAHRRLSAALGHLRGDGATPGEVGDRAAGNHAATRSVPLSEDR